MSLSCSSQLWEEGRGGMDSIQWIAGHKISGASWCMHEVNLKPWHIQAPDQAVFNLYTPPGKPEGQLTPYAKISRLV